MELHQVLIKNFDEFLSGKEVEATAQFKDSAVIAPGERVLAFKDSIAATSSVAVPRNRQDHSIGIEGMVTAVSSRDAMKSGKRLLLKVKKVG